MELETQQQQQPPNSSNPSNPSPTAISASSYSSPDGLTNGVTEIIHEIPSSSLSSTTPHLNSSGQSKQKVAPLQHSDSFSYAAPTLAAKRKFVNPAFLSKLHFFPVGSTENNSTTSAQTYRSYFFSTSPANTLKGVSSAETSPTKQSSPTLGQWGHIVGAQYNSSNCFDNSHRNCKSPHFVRKSQLGNADYPAELQDDHHMTDFIRQQKKKQQQKSSKSPRSIINNISSSNNHQHPSIPSSAFPDQDEFGSSDEPSSRATTANKQSRVRFNDTSPSSFQHSPPSPEINIKQWQPPVLAPDDLPISSMLHTSSTGTFVKTTALKDRRLKSSTPGSAPSSAPSSASSRRLYSHTAAATAAMIEGTENAASSQQLEASEPLTSPRDSVRRVLEDSKSNNPSIFPPLMSPLKTDLAQREREKKLNLMQNDFELQNQVAAYSNHSKHQEKIFHIQTKQSAPPPPPPPPHPSSKSSANSIPVRPNPRFKDCFKPTGSPSTPYRHFSNYKLALEYSSSVSSYGANGYEEEAAEENTGINGEGMISEMIEDLESPSNQKQTSVRSTTSRYNHLLEIQKKLQHQKMTTTAVTASE